MTIAFDGENELISLSAGTTTLSVRDLWSRWVDWWLTDDNSKFGIWMLTLGGNDIDLAEGTKVPIYLFMDTTVKIKPQETNHTLKVSDGILLVAGGGDPFTETTGDYVVRVNYQQPVQAIAFSSGGSSSGLTAEQATRLEELHKLHGLDADTPMTVTREGRTAGNINQVFSGNGETSTTVTRQ